MRRFSAKDWLRFVGGTLGVFTVVCLLAASSEAETNGWEEVFFTANQAYKEGRFEEAIDRYGRLLDSGHRNGHLYYNLGNAHFRLNQIGRAILNYERAHLLLPRDADLKFSLGYARDQTQDAISQPKGFIETTFFWLHTVTLHEVFWGFAGLNLLFWAVLLLRLFRPSEWTFYASVILLVLWLIAGASFGVKYFQQQTDDRAVILAEEVDVLAGPDTEDTLLFKLHEGAIVFLERSEAGWSLVSLPDNKRGWVKKEALEKIHRVTS
ncbi:MAG: SH3 domain-containing protein [Thermodesulfobacteriota bacterium]|nr:SH3 domain-containing protein [Thermodesulfobacteriota bacterium]